MGKSLRPGPQSVDRAVHGAGGLGPYPFKVDLILAAGFGSDDSSGLGTIERRRVVAKGSELTGVRARQHWSLSGVIGDSHGGREGGLGAI
jgi:hypothetical protein